ncbi:energy-coupling factor ABC transporter substrate-binding protein [Arsenicicoccus sp. oral taxon 190]|uniref:energy-coupling factor ABC transporter substrate-binding protein n=1 Tax=Arsenicicoccus sp. oral taxon 190 TaxID=1658671 RepID=UPI00067A0BB9|nr:energy-coupling factor ABC transporter substrate-binding protein [Arsenicicoccus sp. oral taxon 190]AKT52739.1 hypothetical protein ADJ73_09995 [Arsenicicoccus sp. oral taxon 190]
MATTTTHPRPTSRLRGRLVTALCVLALVALFALPLWLDARRSGPEERFGGTDARATEMIRESDPGYQPWFTSFFAPSGGEVESGLFAMQAALGAGVFGYAIGYYRGRGRRRDRG